MPLPAFLAPLLAQGLGLIANAALAKGKDWVEEKTGVQLEQPLSQENIVALKQFELENELELQKLRIEENKLDLEELKVIADVGKNEDISVTQRWQSDMLSDSVLSKNIRPATLLYILTVYTVMAFSSGFGIAITPAYIELLGQWGMLVMTAYFGGRTVEKIIELRNRHESRKRTG